MENAHIRLVVYREREFSDVVAQATREGGKCIHRWPVTCPAKFFCGNNEAY